ncbi:MAG: adenylosuccinate synthetase [Nitrososphaerota archaeon]|nr:adenylosuccinate synthetase [Nitrososphaerota archaeon]
MITLILGLQFGDEGKGKIVDYLSGSTDAVIKFNGGSNAGHTVVCNGKTLKLRMLPSAVVNSKTTLMIGAGVLVDPEILLKEMEETKSEGRTKVDFNCAVIEKKHIDADKQGHLKNTIGTTGTGTGPANSDRVLRIGKVASQEPSLSKYLGNVTSAVNETLDRGETVLVEGTQGTLLSLYHGTYPFVTSKDVSASGICSDVGIGPKRVDEVIAVFKSYLTRVGAGPLEGELSADDTVKRGWQEYGSVTGRLRRAAPFNFELAKKSVSLNSATAIALTKLDALFPETAHARSFDNLSNPAKQFVERVESELRTPVVYIGTGPDAEDLIDRRVK